MLLLIALLLLATACGIQGSSWAGVAASDNNEIFVSYQRFIAKLDSDGERLWTYPHEDDRGVQFYASVTITDEAVYVGDYAGGVHAIDRETGDSLWVYKQSGTKLFGIANFGGAPDRIIGSVEVGVYQGEEVLFVPDEDGVFILNRETGERQSGLLLESDRAIWSKPVYVEGEADRLFVSSLNHFLYAVDLETGEVLWETDMEGSMPGSPVYDADLNTLFIGTFGSEMLAVDAETGAIISRYKTKGWVWDTPVWLDSTLYFGDLAGYLYAIGYSDQTFNEVWEPQILGEGKLRASPLVTEDLIMVGSSDKRVYAVQRETGEIGETGWNEDLGQEAVSSLVMVNSSEGPLVITATKETEKMLVGLRLSNGTQSWSYEHKD
jgi:eukaryotic-like serine/threonine-protein kinase